MIRDRVICVFLLLQILTGERVSGEVTPPLDLPTNGVRLYDNSTQEQVLDFSKVNGDSLSEGLWCQTSASSTVGTWFFPDGSEVQLNDSSRALEVIQANGQIGLISGEGPLFVLGDQGLYTCIIPDEDGINQTLVVAIYTSNKFNQATAPNVSSTVTFTLLSSLDADPPVFTISFSATIRPPTIITCKRNEVELNISEENIARVPESALEPISVDVEITFRTREAGIYICEVVTNDYDFDNILPPTTEPLNITVLGAPENVMSMREDLGSVTMTWSPPPDVSLDEIFYGVFYQVSEGERMSGFPVDETFQFNAEIDQNYTAFVVSYLEGTSLPSVPSEVILVSQVISLSVSESSQTLLYLDNTTVQCEIMILQEVGLEIFSLAWVDPSGMSIDQNGDNSFVANYINNTESASLDLELRGVLLSQAGVYACVATVGLPDMEFNVTRNVTYNVQVPKPFVSVKTVAITSGAIFNTGQVLFLCMIELSGFDVSPAPNMSWIGPNGMIDSSTKYIINQENVEMNGLNYFLNVSLVINDLNITTDNNTVYNCSLSVGAATQFVRHEYIIPNSAIDSTEPLIINEIPEIEVTIDQIGNSVIGETVELICNATITDSTFLPQVFLEWQYDGTTDLPMNVTISEQGPGFIALTIVPVDRYHNGNYTCSGVFMLEGVQAISEASEIISLIVIGNPRIDISDASSAVAGSSNYTLVCTVSVDDGIPVVNWFDPLGIQIIDSNKTVLTLLSTTDLETVLEVRFLNLEYSNAGMYTCIATLPLEIGNFTSIKTKTINVEIPTPNVYISRNMPLGVAYEGTQQTLTCTVDHIEPTPIPIFTDIQWSSEGEAIAIEENRINISPIGDISSELIFSPVGIADSAVYYCTAVITTNLQNVVNATGVESSNLTVQGFPDPNITINSNTLLVIGETFVLSCSVNTIDNLFGVFVDASIVRNGLVLNHTENEGDFIVDFSSTSVLMTDDVGEYSCNVSISEPMINLSLEFSEDFNLSATIPEADISLALIPMNNGSLLEGTSIMINCSTQISSSVNTNDIDVTINWSLHNNTYLTNSSKYTIHPVTKISSIKYENILEIHELELDDSSSPYTCTVSVTSENEHLTGTSTNESITLKITEFESQNVDIVVTQSTAMPIIAGDNVVLNCNVTTPSGFVSAPSSITFAYDSMGTKAVFASNINALQSNVSSDDDMNVYSTSLQFSSVKTSDARVYYCVAQFTQYNVTAVDSISISIKIFPPEIVTVVYPDPPIESTATNITCSATTLATLVDTDVSAQFRWIDNMGKDVRSNSRLIVHSITSENNSFRSVLEFFPIDNGDNGTFNDNGIFTCEVTVTSTDSSVLVIDATKNETININVEDLPEFSLTVEYSGSNLTGNNFTLNCSVNLVMGLVGDTEFTWNKIEGPMMNFNPARDVDSSQADSRVVDFVPLVYDNRGLYQCVFIFDSSITNDNISIVKSYSLVIEIPQTSVEITQSQNGSLYTGIAFELNCNASLSPLIGVPRNVTFVWRRSGNVLEADDNIIMIIEAQQFDTYSSSVLFNPLYNEQDMADYYCDVLVSGDEYVQSLNNTASIDIVVQALPNPGVVITASENIMLGSPYTLLCSVTVLEGLVKEPDTTWTRQSIDSDQINDSYISGDAFEVQFKIPSLMTSDSGDYTCTSDIDFSEEFGLMVSGSNTSVIQLKIPSPNISATYSWGTGNLLITCDISVNMYINTDITVDVQWSKDNNILSNDDRTVISNTSKVASNTYRSEYLLGSPQDSDTDNYTCSVTIIPDPQYSIYLDISEETNFTVIVIVSAPTAPPDNFIVAKRTPFSLTFQWMPPAVPNGPIDDYTLTLDYNNGTNLTFSLGNVLSYTINELRPYQQVIANLSASTVSGPGPESTITTRTLQDTPGPVTNLSVDVVSSSEVLVSWSPVEESNGIITQYGIVVSVYEGAVHTERMVDVSSLNTTITDLSAEVPYTVMVFAINGAEDGLGNTSDKTFFTVEGPPPSPEDVMTLRINGTHMSVSWILIPLTRSRGFIQSYVVNYQAVGTSKRETLTRIVGGEESSITLDDLQPVVAYDVQVAASTGAGMGDFSEPIPSTRPPTQGFQVRAGPFDNCTTINSSYDAMIKSAIRNKLAEVIVDNCGCGFTSSYIGNENLVCIPEADNQIVYTANITEYDDVFTTDELINIISEYIATNPFVSDGSLSFSFNSTCNVQFVPGDEVCGIVPTTNTTEETDSLLFIIIGVALGALVAVILLVIVIVVVCVILKCKNKKSKSGDVELTGYTEVRRNHNADTEASTALNEQVANGGGTQGPLNDNIYSDLSTHQRTSVLADLSNPLYHETDVIQNTNATQNTLYEDLSDIKPPIHRVKNELYELNNPEFDSKNELYAEIGNDKQYSAGRVLTNELYAMPGAERNEKSTVLKNVLYGDLNDTDHVPSRRQENDGNESELKGDGAQGLEYAVIKKTAVTDDGYMIENVGYVDDTTSNEYAAIDQIKKRPPPIDTSSVPLKEQQYEAPWSAKYRSLTRQSTIADEPPPLYDDTVVRKKEEPKVEDDQYEAPWSAKYKSLTRKSASVDERHEKLASLMPVYDDTVVRKKEEPKVEDDLYDAPWSAKYKSLTRKSASVDEHHGELASLMPVYDDTVVRKKEEPKVEDDLYDAPWSAKYKSLTRKSASVDEHHGELASLMPVYDDTVVRKKDTTTDTSEQDNQYESPWSAKYRSLGRTRNSQSFDTETNSQVPISTPVDIPLKPNEQDNDNTYAIPWNSKSLKRNSLPITSKSSPQEQKDGASKPSSSVKSDSDDDNYVLHEYEMTLPMRRSLDHSSIVSEYDELCITKSSSTFGTPSKHEPISEDEYSVPFDSRGKKSQSQSFPSLPQSRKRIRSVPNKTSLAVGSIPEISITANEEYSTPFGNLDKSGDIYSSPFDQIPTRSSSIGVMPNSPLKQTDDDNKESHKSLGDTDAKKDRKGIFSRALKLNKRKDNKSKSNRSKSEDHNDGIPTSKGEELYETIPGNSKSQQTSQSKYASPVDSVRRSISPELPPIPPTRLSIAEKSKQVHLESLKSQKKEAKVNNAGEVYSDPIDLLSKPNSIPSSPTSSPVDPSSPLPYESPIDISPKQSLIDDSSVVGNGQQSIEEIQPYGVMLITNERKPSKDQTPPPTNESPVPAIVNDDESQSPSSVPQPYEIPVNSKDEEEIASEKEQKPSKPPLETGSPSDKGGASVVENEFKSPSVPQPYEIPVNIMADNDETSEKQNLSKDQSKDQAPPPETSDKNGAVEFQSPTVPHPYEVPVSIKDDDDQKSVPVAEDDGNGFDNK